MQTISMPKTPKTFVINRAPLKDVNLEKYESELNKAQMKVLENGDGPCLVLAGAGSGKTRTITYRVAYLLERGVLPQHILLVTFTNKAAQEMTDRITGILGSYPKGLVAGTFHAIGNRVLRSYAEKVGRKSNFTILDASDSKDLIKLTIKDLSIEATKKRFPAASVIADTISFHRNTGFSIEKTLERKYPKWIPVEDAIKDIAVLYKRKKQETNSVDFDDLLELWLELMDNDKEVQNILADYCHYILVDEYQDTNLLQGKIIDHLASVHKNLLVVGDDAQSIYAFRGANIKNILSFPDRYAKTKTFKLEINYRSTPEILSLANDVIEKNTRQFPKKLRSVQKSFVKPVVAPTANAEQEAAFIASMMVALTEEGVPLREIAVLFRSTHHSQSLEFELMKRGIAYDYRGGMKFFERAHIKDAIAFLKLLQNPQDQIAWMRVLTLFAGIGPTTAGRIAERASTLSSLEMVKTLMVEDVLTHKSKIGWQEASEILRDVGIESKPSGAIRTLLKSGYMDYLEQHHPNWRDRAEDLEQFAVFAEKAKSLESFLTDVSLREDVIARRKKDNADDERTVLSTIHQAKGLEWDAVFMMHMNSQSFPHPRSFDEEDGIEEERRLFYVASTRARKQLFLTYPVTSGYDMLSVGHPSLFLEELDDDLTERMRVSEAGMENMTIEVDDDGEEIKSSSTGFLRDVSEL